MIPLSQPLIGEREEQLVLETLRSGRLSLGPMLTRFERSFAERVGAKYQVDLRSFDGDRPGRVVVTIRPTRINAVNMLAES